MRFPLARLSHLFHRRTKSDPELSRLASAPIATPATRPISATHLAGSFATADSTSSAEVFATYVPTGPTPVDGRTGPWQSAHHSSLPASFHHGSADHHRSIVSVLTHRIRDLESELLGEREAHQTALEANQGLANDISVLQSEILHLRRELFSALANAQDGPSPSNSDEQFQVEALASENAVLSTRCDRLKHFLDLMVAAGEPKPVVGAAYRDVLEGEEPEAALVAAIKAAMAQPDNVWRRLLEPVTGVRTQNDYLAQVQCTLDARAQTQDWRKRAKFWKRAAQEDGRHGETVTPSVSAISQVVDVLPRGRMERVGEMLENLKAGTLPLRVQRVTGSYTEDAASEPCRDEPLPVHEDAISAPQSSPALPSSLSASHSHEDMDVDIEPEDTQATDFPTSIPASSSSMVLPPTSSASTARLPPSVHSNLPPLASETFRASHSIKSLSSRSSRRSSLARPVPAPSCSSTCTPPSAEKHPRDSISASISASTQDSTKSRRRRAKIVAVPIVAASGKASEDAVAASTTQSTSRWSFFGPSTSATSAVSGLANSLLPLTVEPQQGPIPSIFEQAAIASDSMTNAPSFEFSVETALDDPTPRTPNRLSGVSLPKALLDFSSSPEDDLVLVLHSDFSSSPYRAPSASPTPDAARPGLDSAGSTPEKRSRLPVRMPGLKAIKRFSASIAISRPVLVDTTNAASFAFTTAPAGSVHGKPVAPGRPGAENADRTRVRARAPSVVARPAGAVSPSPPRPSKIPMGRRLQRFGIGGQA